MLRNCLSVAKQLASPLDVDAHTQVGINKDAKVPHPK